MPLVAAIVVGALVWLASGTLAYAMDFAFSQGKWPSLAAQEYGKNRREALIVGLFGPLGLVSTILHIAGYGEHWYGLKWR